MESLHEWSKQFKCDTLYCCYLHILVEIDDLRTMGFLMGNARSSGILKNIECKV
ncbi:hypothetical protein RhiirA1_479553 [Rhizophagus irregularis]|uniref:Uncharacterized protein n=1 Tax=Rhizophagus irregularis TaxID=588596 RepID=A0A2N0QQ42_9GLOM|nr:hypothetical protein RhiirA1_479873 [Rhizophagus irregularis]PKC53183.1 hypothetical protein RhiirA1_479825 [Rhizophagus irregularis]PKC53310.1 hypothetical protein RhiirA1_479553 [Rhizophagus irregularis]